MFFMWLVAVDDVIKEVVKADVSKDLGTYFLNALFALAGASFTYLVASVRDKEKGKDAAVGKMVEILERMQEKSDVRYDKQAIEHSKDRDAFLENTGRITHSIETSTKVQENIVRELSTLTAELKRSNPKLRVGGEG